MNLSANSVLPISQLSVMRMVQTTLQLALTGMRELVRHSRAVSVAFSEPASIDPDGVLRINKEITGHLEPEAYTVELSVKALNNQERASAGASLLVVEE